MELAPQMPDSGALLARAEELIDQGRPAAARPLLAAVRGTMEPSAGLSVLAARIALSDGQLDTAGDELDRALHLHPDHPGLRKIRAGLRRQLGDLEGATRDAAEAVIGDNGDLAAKALLGDLLTDIGRPIDAVACLGEVVAAKPADVFYREALARAWTVAGDMDTALAILQDGFPIVPGAAALRNASILLCIRRRDFTRATGLAEQSVRDGAADATTFGLLGHALSSAGRHADAALAYGEALKLAPGDAYVRHLVAAAGIASCAPRAPDDYVRTLFDGYADRFESHLVSLGYRIPGLIRHHIQAFAAETDIGPVLDLGCGTGLVALAVSDLEIGPFTGVDLSPRMLDEARSKGLYAELREAQLPAALRADTARWKLIVAADLLCYFGAVDDMLDAVRARLADGGRFILSVEELLPNHGGELNGNGQWALGRQGRYAHDAAYVRAAADAAGFNCLSLTREVLRFEAGGPVAGLIAVLERPRSDA